MKKKIAIILLFIFTLTFFGCKSQSNAKTNLENIPILSEEVMEAHLIGTPREDILTAWGDPDGTLSGLKGDIFKIPNSEKQIILYYDEEDLIANIKLVEQVKSE